MAGTAVAASLGVSLTADSANFESGVDRAARAVRQARSTIDREAQAIARSMQDNASKGAGAFAEQLKSSGKGAAAFAEQLKNSSYQIADFATQIASGQNALVAFTQQGVQFVSSFGTVGAVIGAVGAVVGAVAISLTKADDEAAKTARETANLASVFDELKASTRAAQDEISKITQSYADATDATRLFERQSTEAKIAAAQSAVDAARSKATETIAPFVDPLLERRQRAQLEGPGLISAEQAADAEKIIAAFERFKQGGSIASLDKDFVALQQTLGDRDIAEGAGFIVQQLIAMGQEGEKAEKNLADLRAQLQSFKESDKDFKLPQLPYAAPDRLNAEGSGLSYEGAGLEAIGKPSPVPVARDEAAADADYAQRAAKRQAEANRIAAQGKALTDSLRTAQESYNAKVAEADQLLKRHAITTDTYGRAVAAAQAELDKANAQGERETASQRRIAEAQAEIEQLRQLQAAQGVSAAKYHEVELQIDGERAARQLGIDATQKERDAIAALTIEQEKLKEAMARSQKLDDMSLQIDQQYRLQEAQDQSAKSYYETAKAIEVERAVRELGIGATDAEIQRVRALAAEKYDAENRRKYDATYDPAAGAKEALREMADQATEFGKLAGDALKGAADLGTEAFTEFAMTGKVNMQSLAQEIERSLIQGAIKQLVNSLIGVGGQAFASWLGSGAAPAGNGQSANPAIVTAHAHGGVRSGPSIHEYANSIVRSPTIFRFAKGGNLGLMGEAGPEAILPLKRTGSGDLGVQVASSMPAPRSAAPVINIIDQRQSGADIQTSVRQSDDQTTIDVLIRDSHRKSVNGGEQDRLYQQNYGSRPKPLR